MYNMPAPSYGLGVGDYLRIFRRYALVIVLSTLAAGAVAWVYTEARLTPRYLTSVLIEITKPVLNEQADAWLYYYQGSPIQTAIEQIRSRLTIREALIRLNRADDETPRDRLDAMVEEMLSRLSAEQKPQSNIVSVSLVGTNPEVLQEELEAIAQTYARFEEEWTKKSDEAAIDFLSQRIEIVRKRLADVRARRIAFEIEHPHLSLAGRVGEVLAKREDLRLRIERLETEMEGLTHQRDALANDFERLAAHDAPLADLVAERRRMADELHRLREKYTDLHPSVGRLEENIADLTRRIEERVPVALEKAAEDLDGRIAALEAERAQLREELATLQTRVASLPVDQIAFADLRTEENVLESRYNELLQSRETRELARAMKSGHVQLLGRASPPVKIYPNERANLTLGLSIGLLLGLALAILLESLDTSIRTIEEIEAFIGLPVFGVVPTASCPAELPPAFGLPNEDDILAVIHHHPRRSIAESFRQIATTLDFRFFTEGERSLLVCSATPQEGKTTVISNLGIALAKTGRNVLLMDANLRHPSLSNGFGFGGHLGLAEVLKDEAHWKAGVYPTAIEGLDIFPGGKMPMEPVEIIKRNFPRLLSELAAEYEAIFIDAPPVLPVADASVISAYVDGTLLVYSQGRAPREAMLRAKTRLTGAKGRLVGVVLNNVKPEGELGKDYYYAYYSYYPAYGGEGPPKTATDL